MPHKDPEARKRWSQAYYQKNREKRLAYLKEYFKKHRKKWLAYSRNRYYSNHEECRRQQREYYRRHLKERREYDRKRYHTNPKRNKYANNRWKRPDVYKKILQLSKKRHTLKDPKTKAREALRRAVSRGKISKPDYCSRCGLVKGKRYIHGHHKDYSKPLEVEWICATCHGLEHRLP